VNSIMRVMSDLSLSIGRVVRRQFQCLAMFIVFSVDVDRPHFAPVRRMKAMADNDNNNDNECEFV